MTSSAGAFTSITLRSQIIGTLTKIGKSLINRSDLDVLSIIINELGMALALFIEKEIINNTNAKFQSTLATGVTQSVTGATTQIIDASELVKVKNKVPAVYQPKSAWVMHPDTLTYIQSMKDTTGRYLYNGVDAGLQAGQEFGLLGKPVYLSDQMPVLGSGNRCLYYGDFSGIAIKYSNQLEIDVMKEAFLVEYAVGVAGFVEMDVAIAEPQKLSVYVGK